MNILGEDGGYAPIAPGPIDSSRRRNRNKYTKKIKRTIHISPEVYTKLVQSFMEDKYIKPVAVIRTR
jgi:hypothetical protein